MIKHLTMFALLLPISGLIQSSEIIVCTPVELTYKAAGGELTIYARHGVTSDDSGVLCNSSRSWCHRITLRAGQTLKVHADKTNVSKEMTFFQTEYNSKINYGGCTWHVNM